MKYLLALCLTFTAYALDIKSFKIDHREKSKDFNVNMLSGKKDGIRFYQGTISDVLKQPIDKVLDIVLAFDKRCNNELKEKRTLSDKKIDCPYASDSLIESVIVKDLKANRLAKDEIKRFIVVRRSYNRGLYTYNDLIRVFRYLDGYKITMDMLSDKQSKDYFNSKLNNNSVMKTSGGVYYILPEDSGSTRYTYIFTCSTDHWLLNKSITVGTFFDSMAKNLRDEFNTIKN